MSSKNKKTIIIFAIFLILLNFYPFINKVNAEDKKKELKIDDTIQTQIDTLKNSAETYGYTKEKDISSLIIVVISNALAFIGIIFLVIVIISGFQWMTAGGNEETVQKSKTRIINAIIGTAIVFLTYIIINFLFANLLPIFIKQNATTTL